MTISEQGALTAILYFGQVFVFCELINRNVYKWFPLMMYREHTLSRFINLLNRNHPALCFWWIRGGQQIPNIISFMIRSNCPESCNKFLGSYFFNLWKFLFKIFPDSHFWNHTSEKNNRPVFIKMNLALLLAAYANSLDSFPYKYMSYLWSLIWSNCVWRSWYLIIWLEITVQSSAMNFWTVTFSNWI